MMDPKNVAMFDQAQMMLKNDFAALLRQFYQGLCKQGFSKSEAMVLTCEYMKVTLGR